MHPVGVRLRLARDIAVDVDRPNAGLRHNATGIVRYRADYRARARTMATMGGGVAEIRDGCTRRENMPPVVSMESGMIANLFRCA